ncbi:hypothetical protein OAJ50_05030 [Candidatus Nitrosopelagicus sp.]|nr:hypothetical protein [Candidatus Nitrosopelagicus sp.]
MLVWVKCPRCLKRVPEDRLEKHFEQTHILFEGSQSQHDHKLANVSDKVNPNVTKGVEALDNTM